MLPSWGAKAVLFRTGWVRRELDHTTDMMRAADGPDEERRHQTHTAK